MGSVDQPLRDKPLEYDGASSSPPQARGRDAEDTLALAQWVSSRIDPIGRLLDALVEAWNRELQPLLRALRAEARRLGGLVQVLAEDYDVLRSDRDLLADATAGNVTLTMPPAADVQDYPFTATKIDASTNTVILDFGTETCSGANTVTLTAQYVAVSISSDGVSYFIRNTYP